MLAAASRFKSRTAKTGLRFGSSLTVVAVAMFLALGDLYSVLPTHTDTRCNGNLSGEVT